MAQKKTDTDKISKLLERGVSKIVVKTEFQKLLESGKKIKLYLGIDPTGSTLHLGHAIALRKLREFQELGHHVIFLVGNFTALIGDMSDKDSARPVLTQEQIDENFRTYKEQASKILDFSKIELLYNAEWLSKLGMKDILQLANKFTVQQMIEREMYQKRLKEGKPIGLHEFLYPLMQGYDSVAMNVDLEVGGNDQLFNMLVGRDLQKILNNRDKHVMTMQLLEGTDGRKMSKSYGNVINLIDPPDEVYGKIMSLADSLIVRYFELCTDLSLKEIQEIDEEMKRGGNPRDAKMRLGREIVGLYHGKKSADEAEQAFVQVFRKQDIPENMPLHKLKKSSWNVVDLLVETQLATSKSEARRLVEQGGVKLDQKKVSSIEENIDVSQERVVQIGRRKFVRISS